MSEIHHVNEDGLEYWVRDGVLHNENAPALIIHSNAKANPLISSSDLPFKELMAWYHNGKLHREGAPAVEFSDGTKVWFLNGVRHCETGPAIELNLETPEFLFLGGHQYYINGKMLSREEFEEFRLQQELPPNARITKTTKV